RERQRKRTNPPRGGGRRPAPIRRVRTEEGGTVWDKSDKKQSTRGPYGFCAESGIILKRC
ncbi:MAG: hypothetical protein QF593_08065, partial [Nitrospinota bacterium]|nr:hypothetical protein [Nitrospinota bacterium]